MNDEIKKTKKKYKKATKNFKKISESIDNIDKTSVFVKEYAEKVIWDGNYINYLLGEVENICNLNNDLFIPQIDFLDKQAENILNHSQRVLHTFSNISEDLKYVSGAVAQSDINMGTGVISTYFTLKQYEDENPSISLELKSFEDNPYRKKDKLIKSLKLINQILGGKINEISKSLQFQDTIDQIKKAAHLMREFISGFLQILDPHNNIKNMPWCEYSNGNPIQISRCVFVIIGDDENFNNSYLYYDDVIGIAKNYRNLYQKLNALAHLREEALLIELKTQLNTYYSLLLDYTNIILDLRSLYLNS